MAAPRSTSLRALRVLSQQNKAAPSIRRNLHITGVHSAQTANVSDRASLYSARTLTDLKNECQKRALGATGSKPELVERLSNHDFLQSRAFSIAMRRINGSAFADSARQFNTSRSQKAVNDSSTVDFAYMPSMAELEAAAPRAGPRIPILPDQYSHHVPNQSIPSDAAPPMKPQVYSVSGAGSDVAVSPMTEVVDNESVDIDPFSLTEAVGKSRFGAEMQKQNNGSEGQRIAKQLWGGLLDDLLGPKQSALSK